MGATPRKTAFADASGTLGDRSRDSYLQEGRTALTAGKPGLRNFPVRQTEFSGNTIRNAVWARVSTSERLRAKPFLDRLSGHKPSSRVADQIEFLVGGARIGTSILQMVQVVLIRRA